MDSRDLPHGEYSTSFPTSFNKASSKQIPLKPASFKTEQTCIRHLRMPTGEPEGKGRSGSLRARIFWLLYWFLSMLGCVLKL